MKKGLISLFFGLYIYVLICIGAVYWMMYYNPNYVQLLTMALPLGIGGVTGLIAFWLRRKEESKPAFWFSSKKLWMALGLASGCMLLFFAVISSYFIVSLYTITQGVFMGAMTFLFWIGYVWPKIRAKTFAKKIHKLVCIQFLFALAFLVPITFVPRYLGLVYITVPGIGFCLFALGLAYGMMYLVSFLVMKMYERSNSIFYPTAGYGLCTSFSSALMSSNKAVIASAALLSLCTFAFLYKAASKIELRSESK